ncbi:MAG: hypothetical protein GF317_03190 [Candidatus Lokiarchaeota archaeon]|nr:hypothetical protein [Candidatus Lokiarchaeota archaeon]MBD3198913.1 hypothetical protein [Candidatus Lokiarchaeota archaeon]
MTQIPSYIKINGIHDMKFEYPIRFLHASDIHLGCAQYQNEERADDFISAFKSILYVGITKRVKFILLGGDVFTSIDILPEKLIKIIQILQKFNNSTGGRIPIIAIEGNHDLRKYSRGLRVSRRQSWLELLNILGLIILLDAEEKSDVSIRFNPYDFETRKGGCIRFGQIKIYGTKYTGQTPIEHINKINNAIKKKNGSFNILLQHFGILGQMKNVPGVPYDKIQTLKKKIDYLALGHFHKQYRIENWIFNPGSSEVACSADLFFNRGVFLGELRKNKERRLIVRNITIPTRKSFWETIELNRYYTKKEGLYSFVLKQLKHSLLHELDKENKFHDSKKIMLYLSIKGIKPDKKTKYSKKELRKIICERLSVIDARIYLKFNKERYNSMKIAKFL